MATSGSDETIDTIPHVRYSIYDETELDSESFIDPDSLSHCSDIYAPSYEEAQNVRFKESFYLQAVKGT